tara:strand:+ start:144 stop:518 length:375 start_codon:yes stop_codon:yes gene_type:complete
MSSILRKHVDRVDRHTDVTALTLLMSRLNVTINEAFKQSRLITSKHRLNADTGDYAVTLATPNLSDLKKKYKDELKHIYSTNSNLMYHLNVALHILHQTVNRNRKKTLMSVDKNMDGWEVIHED